MYVNILSLTLTKMIKVYYNKLTHMIPFQDILFFIEMNLTPQMVWIFVAIFLVFIGLGSLTALWHWTSYGIGFLRKASIEVAYIAITAGLVVIFLGAVIRLITLL